MTLDQHAGQGFAEVRQLANGIIIGREEFILNEDLHTVTHEVHDKLGIRLLLSGYMHLNIPSIGVNAKIPEGEIWLRNGAIERVTAITPGCRTIRGLSIDLPCEVIESWQEEGLHGFPRQIEEILYSPESHFGRFRLIDPGIRQIAEALLNMEENSLSASLRYEALTLDLLARIFTPDQAMLQPGTKTARLVPESRLLKAAEILHDEWVTPPTIAQLAKRVGINEFYLKNGFRELFGCSIGHYVRKQRMERALFLIQREGLSVKQAALTVGYSNFGYFSSVFKRYHGELPSFYLSGIGK